MDPSWLSIDKHTTTLGVKHTTTLRVSKTKFWCQFFLKLLLLLYFPLKVDSFRVVFSISTIWSRVIVFAHFCCLRNIIRGFYYVLLDQVNIQTKQRQQGIAKKPNWFFMIYEKAIQPKSILLARWPQPSFCLDVQTLKRMSSH